MNDQERAIRKVAFQRVAEDQRRYDPELSDDTITEIVEELVQASDSDFGKLDRDELMFAFDTARDGLPFTVYVVVAVDTEAQMTDRIRSVQMFIEGSMVVVYNAEYGEEGLAF